MNLVLENNYKIGDSLESLKELVEDFGIAESVYLGIIDHENDLEEFYREGLSWLCNIFGV